MALDFYEFAEECKAQGMSAHEAETEWYRACDEHEAKLIEDYENDPITWAGWAQQDVIDMYRRER